MLYYIYMNEHNGWKNETTWTINVFFMETIEEMLKAGSSQENIEFQIKRKLTQDLYLEQRNIIGCALKLVDWDTLIARATENVEKEKVAYTKRERKLPFIIVFQFIKNRRFFRLLFLIIKGGLSPSLLD